MTNAITVHGYIIHTFDISADAFIVVDYFLTKVVQKYHLEHKPKKLQFWKIAKRTVLEEDYLSNQNKKVRLYFFGYLKLEFVPDDQDKNKPYCLVCCKSLCNDSMRNQKLEDHFKNIHPKHTEKTCRIFSTTE